jgi:hypothetical protein
VLVLKEARASALILQAITHEGNLGSDVFVHTCYLRNAGRLDCWFVVHLRISALTVQPEQRVYSRLWSVVELRLADKLLT